MVSQSNYRKVPGICTEGSNSSIATPNLTPSTNSSFSTLYTNTTSSSNNNYLSSSVPNTPRKKTNTPRSSMIPPSPHRSRIDVQYINRLSSSTNNKQDVASTGKVFFSSPCNSPMVQKKQSRPSSNRTTPTTQQSSSSSCFFSTAPSPERYHQSSPSNNYSNVNNSSCNTPRSNSTLYDNVLEQNTSNNYSDRYIPSRKASNLCYSAIASSSKKESRNDTDSNNVSINLDTSNRLSGGGSTQQSDTSTSNNNRTSSTSNNNISNENANQQQSIIQTLLQSELLQSRDKRQVLRYNSTFDIANNSSIVKPFNLSPLNSAENDYLGLSSFSPSQKRKRRISKVPFKVLDAPSLQDDFYLNLVDWSSQNVLAVGLSSCVYLWSACTSKVTKLCDLSSLDDIVTSVSWSNRGIHLAVGTNRGDVQIWDTIQCKKIRTMIGHSARCGTLSWSNNGVPLLVSGSRDRLIHVRDTRVPDSFICRLTSHKQEVCGLKWSYDEPTQLASGGNDNKLLIWDLKNCRTTRNNNQSQPVHRFTDHTAAVKAIAWSPHQHGLLSSGGGTADRCIRFWNTLSGTNIGCVDTGSQVCNLAWSQNCNELVSTHGYSLNQIVVWSYPTMSKVITLTGHTYRVLYLSVSPDGSTIVTGAGDETLRFWQVFPGPRSHDKSAGNGLLFPPTSSSSIR